MEVEAKFLVPDDETLARLIETASLAGYDVRPGAERKDADTFLDTPGRRLLAAGYYFRRRETTDGVRLTLKQLIAPTDGVLRREEIEALVAADVPVAEWPAGELRTRVEKLTDGEPLEPMLTLSQVRVARVVRKGRREIAELSLDRVTASSPDGDRGWLEAEVEARGRGGDDDIAALAAALRDEWGLVPEGRAKFTRALELAGDEDDGALMSAAERAVHEAHASGHDALARRAQALLALDRGLSQVEAGRVAGLSDRRVRYWLARYRVEGTSIYDEEAVDPGAPRPPRRTEEAARHPAVGHHDGGGGQDPQVPPGQDAGARRRHQARRGPGGVARHARLHAPHAHGAARVRRLPGPGRAAAGAQRPAPHRPHARQRPRPRRLQREDAGLPGRPAGRPRRRPGRPARRVEGRARQAA